MNDSPTTPTLLESLNPSELHTIRRFFPAVTFADGSLLYQQSELADGCYLIESGQVMTFTHMPNIGDVPIGMIGPGDIAGESVLLSAAPRVQSAKAMGPVSALYVDARHLGILQSLINPLHFEALHALATIFARRMQKLLSFSPVNTDFSNPDDRGPLGTHEQPGCSFDYEAFMEVLPVFKGFSRAELKYLAGISTPWEIKRGRYLYVAGEPSESCFITIRGAVEMRYCGQPQGRRINLLGPGRLVDPLELVLGPPRVTEARARESTVVLSFERRKVAELVQDKHPLAAKCLGAAVHEILTRLLRANRVLATNHVVASLGLLGG